MTYFCIVHSILTPFFFFSLNRLCHIVHGPHNEAFHTLWNQLRSEHEQLTRKGYTGEGFLSTGHKLGGGRRIPMHEAQRLARAAAEKRKALTAGSGRKLGGAPVAWGQDIRRVIADAAARRATVTKGCASGTERSRGIVEETSKNGFRTKAEEDDANEEAIMLAYIDLIQEEEREKYGDHYVPASKENPAGSQGAVRPASSSTAPIPPKGPPRQGHDESEFSTSTAPLIDLTSSSPSPSPSPPPSVPSSSSSARGTWTCTLCTLINPLSASSCDACTTPRPSHPPSPSHPPPSSSHRPPPPSRLLSNSTTRRANPNRAIQSLTALSIATDRQQAAKPKPLGWLCHVCGTWMESEWWTCASCGGMKLSS